MSSTVRVPAKINLALGVGPLRDDGFHDLSTVYMALDLCDEVRAIARDDNLVTVRVAEASTPDLSFEHVPTGDDNLAVRAARLLREHAGLDEGVDLAIRKVIPVAGGMAGGSADAAATLVACNSLWGLGLGRAELDELAAELGSDVPFLLHGGIAMGRGRGERVSPVLARGSYQWVIAAFEDGLSTPEVYATFDRLNEGRTVPDPPVPDELLAALRRQDVDALGQSLSNDLQDAAIALRPDLADTLDVGLEAGAAGGIVSGSGPSCVFLVEDEQNSMDVAFALAGSGLCSDVIEARGPVAGAHHIS